MNDANTIVRGTIRRHLLVGAAVVFLLVGGFGGWAATIQLWGAVIAPGMVVVDSSVKKVQHPTGGVVGELKVRDGDYVKGGDILMRLDETQARANLAILTKGLDELAARQTRLEAEREGAETMSFPEVLMRRAHDPDVAKVIAGESKLFELRRSARAGQRAQLRERAAQLREEIEGLTGQAVAKRREIELIEKELVGVHELWRKNLVAITRVTALERDAARLAGDRGVLIASTAQAKGRIAEIELQIIQIDQDLRSEVAKELAEIRAKTSELVERKVAAEDQLKRIDIRAPQDGVVHQLSVFTIGGVVSAGEPIMLIVPNADDLTIEARVAPYDIDQLRVGQQATMRFSSFSQSTTPELNGLVTRVAADITQDTKTGVTYYTVRVSLPLEELARLDGIKLVPGMPAEVFVQTNARTIMSYLVKPIYDQIARTFREK